VDDERKVGGRSFQTRGPETAELREPYVIVYPVEPVPHRAANVEVSLHNVVLGDRCLPQFVTRSVGNQAAVS